MATEKEIKLVEQLLDKTKKGILAWEPTAEEDEFFSTLEGKVSFTVREGQTRKFLNMRDEYDRVLLTVNSSDVYEVIDLYAEARRQALKVDESLDGVLERLTKLDRRKGT
jgi:hypothetical protein